MEMNKGMFVGNQMNGEMEAKIIQFKPREPRKASSNEKVCNLCRRTYLAGSPFSRFCGKCKAQDEVYQYSEWLPAA